MHSSRIRTVRNSSRLLAGGPGPKGVSSTPPETCCKACWDTTCKACWDTSPPTVDSGQTHTCKNITFATSLRTVKIWSPKAATQILFFLPLSLSVRCVRFCCVCLNQRLKNYRQRNSSCNLCLFEHFRKNSFALQQNNTINTLPK